MSIWTKDQHFVPQAYLRLFSSDHKNVWVYDSRDRSIRQQSIKDTGFIKWFYLSKLHPAPLETKEVSQLEGKAKAIIQKIEKRETLNPAELGQLVNFVALQFLRTPASRKRIESGLKTFWSELRTRYRETNDEGKINAEKIAESFLTDQKIQSTPKDFLLSGDDVEMPQEFFPQTIIFSGQSLMKKFGEQGWEFLSAEGAEFITSDDPLSLVGNDGSSGISIGKDVYKIIPLSKKLCLVIGGSQREIIIKKMYPWAVKIINLNIADLSDRYVYASSESLLRGIVDDLPKIRENPDSFIPASPNEN